MQAAQSSLSQAEQIAPFRDVVKRQSYFDAGLERARQLLQEPPVRTELKQSPQATVQIASGFEQSSPGQLVTWTLITLLGASEVFVNERLGGTLRRLLATPTRKSIILLGKITARLGMGLFQMALLIGFGALALGVNWGRSWAALALVSAAFALAAVALGTLLGALVRSRSQASGLTIMFSMLLSALGGAWWPLEVTPPAYQAVVKVLPTTWAMIGFNDVILRGQGVSRYSAGGGHSDRFRGGFLHARASGACVSSEAPSLSRRISHLSGCPPAGSSPRNDRHHCQKQQAQPRSHD